MAIKAEEGKDMSSEMMKSPEEVKGELINEEMPAK